MKESEIRTTSLILAVIADPSITISYITPVWEFEDRMARGTRVGDTELLRKGVTYDDRLGLIAPQPGTYYVIE